MNSLARFAAHQPAMDGMHSAGMQPEGGGRFFYRAMPTLPGLFCGSVIGNLKAE
jgi:hypothetical protein